MYLGETSRSSYQRGREHLKEIQEATPTHPLVIHNIEEHGGETQEILMRTLTTHLSAMERQVQESLNIIQESKKPGNCLNVKSEWAGSKIPGLQVHLPKGTAATRQEKERGLPGTQEMAAGKAAGEGGAKRLRTQETATNMEGMREEKEHTQER